MKFLSLTFLALAILNPNFSKANSTNLTIQSLCDDLLESSLNQSYVRMFETKEALNEIFLDYRKKVRKSWKENPVETFKNLNEDHFSHLILDTWVVLYTIKNTVSHSSAKQLVDIIEANLKGKSFEIPLRKALSDAFENVFSNPYVKNPLFSGIKFVDESVDQMRLEQLFEQYLKYSSIQDGKEKDLLWMSMGHHFRMSYDSRTSEQNSLYEVLRVIENIKQLESLGISIEPRGRLIAGIMKNGAQSVLELILLKLKNSKIKATDATLNAILYTVSSSAEFLEGNIHTSDIDPKSILEDPTPSELDPQLKKLITQILMSYESSVKSLSRPLLAATRLHKTKELKYSINLAFFDVTQ
jgi:hypothetical protein